MTDQQKPKCGKGQSCGYSCIEMKDTCKELLDLSISSDLVKLVQDAVMLKAKAIQSFTSAADNDLLFDELAAKYQFGPDSGRTSTKVGGLQIYSFTLKASDGSEDTMQYSVAQDLAAKRSFTVSDGLVKEVLASDRSAQYKEALGAALRAKAEANAESGANLVKPADSTNEYIARLPKQSSSPRPEGSFGPDSYSANEQKTIATGLEKLLDEAEVRIRFGPGDLQNVLDSGRMLTSFVTGRSGGDSDVSGTSQRVSAEQAKLGVPATRSTELDLQRPVYGYFAKQGEPDSSRDDGALDGFGDVIVKLKQSAKHKSSFTVGDSFESTSETYVQGTEYTYSHYNVASSTKSVNINVLPVRVTARQKAAFDLLSKNSVEQVKLSDLHSGTYVEAQVHGGVKISDIAKVMIPSGMKGFSKAYDADFETLTKSLSEKGIAYEIYDKPWSD